VRTSMATLAGWTRRRRRLVLLAWLVVLLVAAPFAARQSTHLTGGGFDDPHSQSAQVKRQLASFPGAGESNLAIVLMPRGDATRRDLAAALREAREAVAGTASATLGPVVPTPNVPNRGAGPTLVTVRVAGSDGAATDSANELRDAFGVTESAPGSAGPRVDVAVVGQGGVWAALQAESERDVKMSETRAFPAIAIVLLAVFGSLAAALLPLALGAAALVVSGALIFFLSLTGETSVLVTSVSSMLGLGVAVDYSLFILVRYREEIAGGAGRDQALSTALSTSGLAVLFSGLTVMASLAGLFFIDSPALRSIATGAIVVVAVSVLAAATLLPAVVAALGDRVHQPGRLGLKMRHWRGGRDAGPSSFWARWSSIVMRRPLAAALLAAATLLTLAAPALNLRIENAGMRQVGKDDPVRIGVSTASAIVGQGALGPVEIAISRSAGEGPPPGKTIEAVRRTVVVDPGIARVSAPRLSSAHGLALLTATLDGDPTSDAARATVGRLRAELPAVIDSDSAVGVGGTTATIVDFDHLVSSSLWKLALFVCALCFLVMVPLLRSVVLPLKAVLMTMLSVLAAYGVVVAIFQYGWLGFLGLDQAPYVDTITPPLILVIAFGLSMDYEVFMLSRIRERYEASGDTRQAVAEGLASTGRTITSAALIMVLVFLAFVSSGLPSVQRLGIGLAAAVALDATLVRLVLVPAAMALLDQWNWWLPRPLRRLLAGASSSRRRPPLPASAVIEEEVG